MGQQRKLFVLRKLVDLGIVPVEKVRGNPKIKELENDFTDILVYLIKEGIANEQDIKNFFVKHFNFKPFTKDLQINIPKEILEQLSFSSLNKEKFVPISYNPENNSLTIVMLNPLDKEVINYLKFIGIKSLNIYVATLSEVEELLKEVSTMMPAASVLEDLEFGENVAEEEIIEEVDLSKISKEAEEAPIIKLSYGLIEEAYNKGASDIHIEPFEKEVRVRYRIDGILRTVRKLPTAIKDSLVARYKIMAKLDISEKRLPQDGRIRVNIAGKKVDLRMSTVPTVYGEKIVMRLQDSGSYLNVKLENLGFEEDDLVIVRKGIYSPWGMVLVTGPTGSGKTTTLYSALMERNKEDVNISTAEDPVEVSIPGINQVQVKEQIGLTFASVLRAFLRQDPDIILVGEIRDGETAEIAIKAALTGHLVFSTLHTNDAPSSITRLIDIGVDKFLVSTAVNLIIAQRLIRKLCNECKMPIDYDKHALKGFGLSDEDIETGTFFKHNPEGCPKCNHTGYKGRTAVHEILWLDDEIKKAINQGATSDQIKEIAIKKGMRTLYQDGLIKFKKGITDIAEIERVLMK